MRPSVKRVRKAFIWVLSATVLIVVAGACAQKIALVEPQTVFGVTVFKWRYNSAADKGEWLRKYHQNLIDYNGGYVPTPVDRFLITQVSNTKDDTEIRAIAAFYAKMGGQRTTDGIVSTSADTKARLIFQSLIVSANFDIWHKERALVFIDELRLGKTHYKSSINLRAAIDGEATTESWSDEKRIGLAHKEFFKWWSRDMPWAEKCKVDPLAETPLVISGP